MLDKIGKKGFFFILLAFQIIILLLQVPTKQVMNGMMIFILRIMLLTAANCCNSVSWAALYSVFALLSALYSFDPVGVFLTGHGEQKKGIINIFCILICILHVFSSYIGYLYTCAIQSDINNSGNNNLGYLNPNNRQPNYLYNNPSNNTNKDQRNDFQPFIGYGHSLQ